MKYKCVICGKEFKGYGNTVVPFKKAGVCCNRCNIKYVIPMRIIEYKKEEV